MEKSSQIKCPRCGEAIDVQDVLVHQVQEEFKEKVNQDFKILKEKYDQEKLKQDEDYKLQVLKLQGDFQTREKAIFEKEKEILKAKSDIEKQILERLKEEKEIQAITIKEKVHEEYAAQIKFLEKETEEGKLKAKLLQDAEFEKMALNKQIREINEGKELEFAQRMEQMLKQEAEAINKKAHEAADMKLKEREIKIDELTRQINDLQRRAEQGSMQLQGEAQEMVLEEALRGLFKYDTIEEVGKGVKGADIIQIVRNQFGQECGKILYESKRTKHFGADWADKLKQDGITAKADICVIVTEALPEGIDKIGLYKDVWVCTYSDFRGLAIVLRDSLIRISAAYTSQAGKGEKMQYLYDYLSSQEFTQEFRAVMKGYENMKNAYQEERLWMERNWKKREKQLDMILVNAGSLLGSLQGIAGDTMPDLQLLGNSLKFLEGGGGVNS
jgi:hypothetical protein